MILDLLLIFSSTIATQMLSVDTAPASAQSGWKGWSFHCLGENKKKMGCPGDTLLETTMEPPNFMGFGMLRTCLKKSGI